MRAAGVTKAVVNVHYLPEQIEAWASGKRRRTIEISDERAEILDTGGGIARALPLLGDGLSSCSTATASGSTAASLRLQRLREAWDDATMDCLLLSARSNDRGL